jgi:hypothetical protein
VSVAKPARQARKVRLALKARREKLVHRDQRDLPAKGAKLDRKAPQIRLVQQDPLGPKGDSGPSSSFRVVSGTDNVHCGDDEILVSLVCASGASDGAKCATSGTAATLLCARR